MTSIQYAAEGDLVDVYGTVLAVTEYLIRTDELVLSDGRSFFASDIEPVPVGDDVESWLEAPSYRVKIRPKPHHIETVRCAGTSNVSRGKCECTSCYSNVSFGAFVQHLDAYEIIEKHHFLDNQGCQCGTKGCPCVD